MQTEFKIVVLSRRSYRIDNNVVILSIRPGLLYSILIAVGFEFSEQNEFDFEKKKRTEQNRTQ